MKFMFIQKSTPMFHEVALLVVIAAVTTPEATCEVCRTTSSLFALHTESVLDDCSSAGMSAGE